MYFQGAISNTMDKKGRVAIPARFRQVLKGQGDERLVVTIFGVSGVPCLEAWPTQGWHELLQSVENAPDRFSDQHLIFETVYIGSGEECDPDSQGRILLPALHRGAAELSRDLFFVGAGSRIRIFSKENHAKVFQEFMSRLGNPAGEGFSGLLSS